MPPISPGIHKNYLLFLLLAVIVLTPNPAPAQLSVFTGVEGGAVHFNDQTLARFANFRNKTGYALGIFARAKLDPNHKYGLSLHGSYLWWPMQAGSVSHNGNLLPGSAFTRHYLQTQLYFEIHPIQWEDYKVSLSLGPAMLLKHLEKNQQPGDPYFNDLLPPGSMTPGISAAFSMMQRLNTAWWLKLSFQGTYSWLPFNATRHILLQLGIVHHWGQGRSRLRLKRF